MGLKNFQVPRNADDRKTVDSWQQLHGAVGQLIEIVSEFDVHIPLPNHETFGPFAYNPATDASLDIWLDASDTTTLFDAGGAAITNGAVVGRWESKAVARSFQQYAATARPSWFGSGWMGLPAVRSNSQLLKATSSAGYAALSGITVLVAQYMVAPVAGNGCSFGITEPHEVSNADSSLVFLACNQNGDGGGGRRHQGDTFGSVADAVSIGNNVPLITGLQLDYINKTGCSFLNGAAGVLNVPFQIAGSGTTAAAPNPFGISVGGFAQETAAAIGIPMNGWIEEVLVYKSALTPAQMVPRMDYLVRRWRGGFI